MAVGVRLVTGHKEIDAALRRLKVGAANKMVRPGLAKAVRLVAKEIKAKIPSPYKNAKRAIGGKVDKKGKGNQFRAKAGAAVGMKAEKVAEQAEKAGKKSRGVGISARNIHWFVLGTGPRVTKSGQQTGTMPAVFPDAVIDGFRAAESQAMQVILETARKGLRELASR